ncbi:hypothetical protein N657DRAFT_236854 [Parathielavia appendiculata]|uniref:Apple domain-containing protein n=1 Tax=Parathielavia appendiculata TaxID=2587402 RepID=A0AAN6U7M9_9PEZI|nr:hypothetical protein N657DRAFT_236854 [Parathielavia appendiculata]
MTTITRFMSLILFAAFALVASAAPYRSDDNTITDVMHRRTPAPIQGSPTRDAMASACTNGTPASKQHPAGYPINNYTVVTPDGNSMTSYTITEDWYGDHFVSGPHIMNFNHKSDPYGPFKCQYTCNANGNCNAYFVWYEDVGTDHEHLKCVLFDAIIPPSVFVEVTGTIASGAYDRLCDHSS